MNTFCALLLWLALLTCCFAKNRPIDTTHSKITIHVGKSGLFSVAGHDHEVTAPISEGMIDDEGPGHIWFRIEAARIAVLPEKDQNAVQSTMQREVLESDRFPEIRFESNSVKSVDREKWIVTGKLTLHGHTNAVTVDVRAINHSYVGEFRLKQTQFGIQPVRVAGGAVWVKDELKIDFVIFPGK